MKKRFTEEQIIGFLRQAQGGVPVKELCRKHGLTLSAKRAAVAAMRKSTTISERRACRLVGLSRTVLSYVTKPDPEAVELRDRLADLAATRRRFGYRRLHALLRREGMGCIASTGRRA